MSRARTWRTPVAHLGATDLDRPDPGLDCTMRPMAMTHHAVAAIRQLQALPQGDKGIDFGNQHLSQHSAGAFTGDFRQVIVGGLGLTERNDSDPPPSIKRRHPDSGIARRADRRN